MNRPRWSDLPARALMFRLAHIAWGMLNLVALAHMWASAITGRRSSLLAGSVGMLAAEGLALVVGRGNCPFGSLQRSLGDPVPMFELFLPPRAAKAAIPILTVISLAGFAALFVRVAWEGGFDRARVRVDLYKQGLIVSPL